MRRANGLHLRAIQTPRNGRPARRTRAARALLRLVNRRPSLGLFRGWGFFGGVRRAVSEIMVMAFVLALSIVLAHAMLIVLFPV